MQNIKTKTISHLKNQRVSQDQKQSYLQMLDDTWERLIIALERYEKTSEGFKNFTAAGGRRDNHPDKYTISETIEEIEFEVILQIQALRRVVKPITEEVSFFIKDFIHWLSGRSNMPFSDVDHFIGPVFYSILCQKDPKTIRILWERAKGKELPDVLSSLSDNKKEKEFLNMWQNLEVGKALTETMLREFQNEQNKRATVTQHKRGSFVEGFMRAMRYFEKMNSERYFKEVTKRFFPNYMSKFIDKYEQNLLDLPNDTPADVNDNLSFNGVDKNNIASDIYEEKKKIIRERKGIEQPIQSKYTNDNSSVRLINTTG